MMVKSNCHWKKNSILGASSEIQANWPSQYVSVPQLSTNLIWKVERQWFCTFFLWGWVQSANTLWDLATFKVHLL